MQTLISRLKHYDAREARSIVLLLLEELFGISLTDVCLGAINKMSAEQRQKLEEMMVRLKNGEPIQYVIGHAYFFNRKYNVRQGCLIPRPETEELCQWIINNCRNSKTILDIGTGSGCIAITLKKELPEVEVTAWDISHEALSIARENAKINDAQVIFEQQDILSSPTDNRKWDVIVSNPPYICNKEAKDMEKNVLDFEPHSALFVPDGAPLLFYDKIMEYGKDSLAEGGTLFFEINPLYVTEMVASFEHYGFKEIEIHNDAYGKARMMKATKR